MRELLKVYTDVFDRTSYPNIYSGTTPPDYRISYLGSLPVVDLVGTPGNLILVPVAYLVINRVSGNSYSAVLQLEILNSEPFDDGTYFDDGFGFSIDPGSPEAVRTQISWGDTSNFLAGCYIVSNSRIYRLEKDIMLHDIDATLSLVEGNPVSFEVLSPGTWGIAARFDVDFSVYIPHNEQGKPLVDSFSRFLSTLLGAYDYMANMENTLRNHSIVSESYVPLLRETLGLTDIGTSELPVSGERVLVSELPSFYTKSGSRRFLRLMKLATGIDFELDPLWTSDYKSFVTKDSAGPSAYPTSRVNLRYELSAESNLTRKDVESLFYSLAPIELVLWEVVGSTRIESNIYLFCSDYVSFVWRFNTFYASATYFFGPFLIDVAYSGYYFTDIPQGSYNLSTVPSLGSFLLDCTISFGGAPSGEISLLWRYDPSQKRGYYVRIQRSGSFTLYRDNSVLATYNHAAGLYTGYYRVKVLCVGDNHKIRVWSEGASEPSSWNIDVNDGSYSSGRVGVSLKEMDWIQVNQLTTEV